MIRLRAAFLKRDGTKDRPQIAFEKPWGFREFAVRGKTDVWQRRRRIST
jgi:hypothetical protein